MNRQAICEKVEACGLVPIVRARSAEYAVRAANAVMQGGVSVFEITLTVPGALEVIEALSQKYQDSALIGAGTVLSADEARRCVKAGARFIVSPGLDLPTIAAAAELGVPVMPGALTPTEIIVAWKAGAALVKIFPCSAMGGPSYLKALRGPLPQIKLMPTGGVNLTTAGDYIKAGAAALGVGSELVNERALDAGRDHELTEKAEALVEAVRVARSG